MRSCWVKLGIFFAAFLLIAAGAWFYFDAKYGRMIEAELARIRAEGWPTTPAEIAPQPVPDDENAAVLYQRVFEVNIGTGQVVTPTYPLPDIPWNDETFHEFYRDNPSAESKKLVREILTKPQTVRVLEVLRQASERPHCVFPMDWDQAPDALIPAYADFRACARLLGLRALASAREGRIAEALDWCQVGLRVSEHVGAVHTVIGQLVAYAMQAIMTKRAQHFLDIPAVRPEDAQRMETYLCQVDLYTPFTEAMAMERAEGLATFEMAHRNPAHLHQRFCDHPYISPPPLCRAHLGIRCSPLGAPALKLDKVHFLQVMCQAIKSSKKPYRLAKADYEAQKQMVEELPYSHALITKMLFFTDGRAAQKRDAYVAGLGLFRVALALKAHKYHHSRYPSALAELEETLDWQPPEDPFSGKDFVYQREGEGFKLYSLGPDLTDSGGTPRWDGCVFREDDYDIVWECRK